MTWQQTLHVTLRSSGAEWKAVEPRDLAQAAPPPELGDEDLPAGLRRGARGDDGSPRYRIESALGTGATAGVWAVYDRRLRRPLAAKVLERGADDAAAVAAFIQEARTTAGLQHPNVLPVHEVDVAEDGRPFFTMNRVDGRSLGRIIAESTVERRHAAVADLNAVVSLTIAVANALSYAHHRGIVHQDVKPDNVMLGDFGEVLLVDWGSAQRIDVHPRSIYGTPLYMSPEQARREEADERSDVWCLGATLFHALCLRPPLWDEDEQRFWRRKRAGEIDAPTADERHRLPAPLLAIALKAMAAHPRARYPTADALIADLRAFQAGLAVSAQPETIGSRAVRWCRRNAHALALGLPVAVCIAALALLLYGQQLKQMALWGAPVVVERFADPALPGWILAEGRFAARDGAVVSNGTGTHLMILDRRLEGDIAVEYDAWIEPGAHPGDLSLMLFPDYDPAIDHGEGVRYERALQVQFGAHEGAHSMITVGQHVAYGDARPLRGTRHHVRVEFRDNLLTLAVDGAERCRHVDALPLRGGHLGLYAYHPGHAFADLRVWVRHVPQLVAATAVGDALLRAGDHERAAAEYQRVLDAHPATPLAAEAAFRAGFAWWRKGDEAAAERAWLAVAGTAWGDEVALLRLGAAIDRGDDGTALEAFDRLAATRPALGQRLADVWCTAVETLCRRPATPANRAHAQGWLDLRDRRLGDRPTTAIVAPVALLYLERWQDVLDRFPEQHRWCCSALVALGHPEQVAERYPDEVSGVWDATKAMARYEDLAGVGFLPSDYRYQDDAELMRELGEAERAASLWWAADAQIDVGRFDHAFAIGKGETFRRAMVIAGRAAELPESEVAGDVGALLALGRVEEAVAAGEALPYHAAWPRRLLGLRATIAGDATAARRWLEVQPQREFTQLYDEPARTVVVPFLRELGGDAEAWKRDLAATVDRWRWLKKQRPWHLARYLLGGIDETGFRAQPYRAYLEADLTLARAVRAEHEHRTADALVDYRVWSAMPRWKRAFLLDPVTEEFVAWRLAVLAGR